MTRPGPQFPLRITRRGVLSSAVGVVLALTGCITDTNEDDDEPETEEPEDGTDHEMNDITGTEFDILDIQSGIGEDSAAVTFENDCVCVRGTIMGRNSCYTARLADVFLSNETCTVAIESYEDANEGEMCATVLVDIEYKVRIEFDSRAPNTVVIEHNDETVTTEERES